MFQMDPTALIPPWGFDCAFRLPHDQEAGLLQLLLPSVPRPELDRRPGGVRIVGAQACVRTGLAPDHAGNGRAADQARHHQDRQGEMCDP